MKRECVLLVLVASISGCGLFPNRSLDYLQASTLPESAPQSNNQREIKALYVIPKVTTPIEQAAVVITGTGRKQEFVAPSPKSVLPQDASVLSPKIATVVSAPQMVFDGNNVPMLHIAGNHLQVWEQIGQAIKTTSVVVVDRNQSLGLYYLELIQDNKKQTYLLKLTQISSNNVVSVQKDSDTLADSKLSQQILLNIIKHWPS